jgi:hypothetical protein
MDHKFSLMQTGDKYSLVHTKLKRTKIVPSFLLNEKKFNDARGRGKWWYSVCYSRLVLRYAVDCPYLARMKRSHQVKAQAHLRENRKFTFYYFRCVFLLQLRIASPLIRLYTMEAKGKAEFTLGNFTTYIRFQGHTPSAKVKVASVRNGSRISETRS